MEKLNANQRARLKALTIEHAHLLGARKAEQDVRQALVIEREECRRRLAEAEQELARYRPESPQRENWQRRVEEIQASLDGAEREYAEAGERYDASNDELSQKGELLMNIFEYLGHEGLSTAEQRLEALRNV